LGTPRLSNEELRDHFRIANEDEADWLGGRYGVGEAQEKNETRQDEGVTTDVVSYAVKRYAKRIGIGHLVPHDLRRTCARLCHEAGGELEQIQFLLGHASVQTAERYIGCRQNLREAVNDRFRISPSNNAAYEV